MSKSEARGWDHEHLSPLVIAAVLAVIVFVLMGLAYRERQELETRIEELELAATPGAAQEQRLSVPDDVRFAMEVPLLEEGSHRQSVLLGEFAVVPEVQSLK
jgi:hypothetical protein